MFKCIGDDHEEGSGDEEESGDEGETGDEGKSGDDERDIKQTTSTNNGGIANKDQQSGSVNG